MPATSFMIKYKPNDFFYNIVDSTRNTDLLASFPFNQTNVIEWANRVAQLQPPITSVIDIFDEQLSNIILNPKYDFKNTFLPGNMIFNDKFDKLTMNLTGISITNTQKISKQTAQITGNIVLKPISPNDKPTTLEIKTGDSNINWEQDETNAWQPAFDINASLSQEIPFTDVDGGQSKVIMTSGNPRCKFRASCTMNHWHYSKPCTTQIINENGQTSCKCQCSGVPVFNNQPHSHCDPYVINPDGSVKTQSGSSNPPTGLGLVAAIQGMKFNLKANFPQSQFFDEINEDSSGNVSLPFSNSVALNQNSETIRQLVYDYYFTVSKNITLQKTIQSKSSKDITSNQALIDATIQYKLEYLNVFNIIVGVFGTTGYIYLMLKS